MHPATTSSIGNRPSTQERNRVASRSGINGRTSVTSRSGMAHLALTRIGNSTLRHVDCIAVPRTRCSNSHPVKLGPLRNITPATVVHSYSVLRARACSNSTTTGRLRNRPSTSTGNARHLGRDSSLLVARRLVAHYALARATYVVLVDSDSSTADRSRSKTRRYTRSKRISPVCKPNAATRYDCSD